MVEAIKRKISEKISKIIKEEVNEARLLTHVLSCAPILLASYDALNINEDDLINASVSAEFFYRALNAHYADNDEKSNVIMGDYYGAIALLYAAKLKDDFVIGMFCKAIQKATKDEDNKYKAFGRLAKICGASAVVGAYLAGHKEEDFEEFRELGEVIGLENLGALDGEDLKRYQEKFGKYESLKDCLSVN